MKAGTLEIEMITNVARLQKEMADMKRAVGGAMGDIAATAGRADRAIEAVGTSRHHPDGRFGKAGRSPDAESRLSAE